VTMRHYTSFTWSTRRDIINLCVIARQMLTTIYHNANHFLPVWRSSDSGQYSRVSATIEVITLLLDTQHTTHINDDSQSHNP